MTGNLRRRAPRAATEQWPGKYLIDDDQSSGWRECIVLDLSNLGVGLESVDEVHPAPIGQSIQVEVDMGDSASIHLRLAGVVRNLGPGKAGRTRIGVEFTGLSEREEAVLKTMEYLNIRW
ncbi:MAG TPA: hypothetical protein DCQ30_00120 [Acidimicrobiaceae bacterium]|nr:hypothetical protein [Acidimicrobiaceae bacterium]